MEFRSNIRKSNSLDGGFKLAMQRYDMMDTLLSRFVWVDAVCAYHLQTDVSYYSSIQRYSSVQALSLSRRLYFQ